MRSLGFWVLFVAVGAALSSHVFVCSRNPSSSPVWHGHGESATLMTTNRILKEKSYELTTSKSQKRDLGIVNQEDYPRFDPAPSSKAAITSGPIEHGTPLMPYVPRPTPPPRPRHGGSP